MQPSLPGHDWTKEKGARGDAGVPQCCAPVLCPSAPVSPCRDLCQHLHTMHEEEAHTLMPLSVHLPKEQVTKPHCTAPCGIPTSKQILLQQQLHTQPPSLQIATAPSRRLQRTSRQPTRLMASKKKYQFMVKRKFKNDQATRALFVFFTQDFQA